MSNRFKKEISFFRYFSTQFGEIIIFYESYKFDFDYLIIRQIQLQLVQPLIFIANSESYDFIDRVVTLLARNPLTISTRTV